MFLKDQGATDQRSNYAELKLCRVVVHACNPGTQEAEAGGLQVQGQP
jgi:hypothetical protein